MENLKSGGYSKKMVAVLGVCAVTVWTLTAIAKTQMPKSEQSLDQKGAMTSRGFRSSSENTEKLAIELKKYNNVAVRGARSEGERVQAIALDVSVGMTRARNKSK
ncbi:MAG TPA: hypothetical protein DCF62_05850 [Porticoccaceae bacterium]|nr:hypothetical protein [Porticoccaceae bacterium]HCO60452.1 hypothetical protein [Porticoccaceae bacterium]